jgi:uncharacterized RDD family membrane protein YckC
MTWYYVEKGERVGPLSDREFDDLIASGRIRPETLVWNETLTAWTPLARLRPPAAPSAAPVDPAARAAAAAPAGASFAPSEVSPARFEMPDRSPAAATEVGRLPYAGFWMRFGAKFIDWLILWCFSAIVRFGLGGPRFLPGPGFDASREVFTGVSCLVNLIVFAAGLAYYVFFVGRFGATPGKMALKLKIVRPDGSPVSYGRATGRYFAEILSAIILCIGYLMAAFDEEKRTLHDRICETRVIRV